VETVKKHGIRERRKQKAVEQKGSSAAHVVAKMQW